MSATVTQAQVMPQQPPGPITESYARARAASFAWMENSIRNHLRSGKAIREIFPSRSQLWRWTGNPLNFEAEDVVTQIMMGFLHFQTEIEFVND